MERSIVSPTSAVLMLGVFFLSFGLIAPRAWASSNDSNPKVERLLSQASYQAWRLNKDANRMTELINSDVGWHGRADQLALVRARVNKLGKVIYELQSPRANTLPWQKRSIDSAVPLLRKVALNTTDEIHWLNSNAAFPNSPQYNKLAFQSAHMSHKLAKDFSDIIQYGKDRSQLARISDNLDFGAHATANG